MPLVVLCTIQEGVTEIGDAAFSGCSGLIGELKIPSSVTSIGASAFSGCSNLTTVNISSKVNSIGGNAFKGCSNLTFVKLNNNKCVSDFKSAFPSLPIKSIELGDNITSISDFAFNGCSSLKKVNIGNGITEIGKQAFEGCSGLETVTIPKSVTHIYNYAFNNCSCLNNVTVSGNLKVIGKDAFSSCTGLNNFTYQGTTAPIYHGNSNCGVGFSECYHLEKVNVPDNYEGNDFCGYETTKENRQTIKDWFTNNVAWIAPAFTIIGGIATTIGLIIKYDKAKNFCLSHCSCCPCCHEDLESSTGTILDEKLL